MHVLMLGWEFPPYITGGLGTACHGLTQALDRRGVQVTFVLPKAAPADGNEHVTLVSPSLFEGDQATPPTDAQIESWYRQRPSSPAAHISAAGAGSPGGIDEAYAFAADSTSAASSMPNVSFLAMPAGFVNPYQREPGNHPVSGDGNAQQSPPMPASTSQQASQSASDSPAPAGLPGSPGAPPAADAAESHAGHNVPEQQSSQQSPPTTPPAPLTTDYAGDLMGQVQAYARFCAAAVARLGLRFDVIHAHDWLTYPAGLRIARLTGKPLVVHVHSTEFDRSGEHVNQQVYDIERRGMHGAMRVLTVSQLTRNVVTQRYGVPEARTRVCYNGVDLEPGSVGITGIESRDRIVLYFGRITYQKGPEYFIRAAKRVLELMDNVKFVVAGSGDQAQHMIEMAAAMGIGHKMLFTGFLRGRDIKRVFAMADLYVMPSVSEPFGIAPLEAIGHDVPVLISKTSGVSEVLSHALKVDFWDVDDMANKIIAVLRYPPLGSTLREHASLEVRGITWDGAATRCEQVYSDVIREMTSLARRR